MFTLASDATTRIPRGFALRGGCAKLNGQARRMLPLSSVSRLATVTLLAALGVTACRQDHTPAPAPSSSLAEDGTDASDIESTVSALTATTTLATSAFDQPLRAALAARLSTKSFFLPSTCVTSSVDARDAAGATVVHEFAGCTGPWGLAKVSGKVTVHFGETTLEGNPALELEVTGEGLSFRRGTADYHATAVVSGNGTARTMVYKAQLSGTTSRGKSVARTVDWRETWTVGEQCLTLDGTTDGSVNNRSLRTTVKSYQRCRGECPAAGGNITIDSSKTNESVSIDFDGSATASVTTNGAKSTVSLACGL